jgi:hypothetical protein
VLRHEGEQYANKLREAGVDVTSVRVAGMVHGFLLLDSLRDTKAANAARRLAVDFLREAFASDPAKAAPAYSGAAFRVSRPWPRRSRPSYNRISAWSVRQDRSSPARH